MHKHMKKHGFISLAALLLAACGGGGGGAEPAPVPPQAATEVPASAGASVQAFVDYLGALPAEDRRDALGVDAVEPPTSDTTEPAALE